jgi:hypothetical protein
VVDDGLDDESLAKAPICPLSGMGSNQPSGRVAAGPHRGSSDGEGVADAAGSAVGKAPATAVAKGSEHQDVRKDLFRWVLRHTEVDMGLRHLAGMLADCQELYTLRRLIDATLVLAASLCGCPCRQHFDTLDQASGTTTPAPAGQLPAPDPRRHSLTAVYRQLAKSLLAAGPAGEALVTAVVGDQAGAVAAAPEQVAVAQVTAGTPGAVLGFKTPREVRLAVFVVNIVCMRTGLDRIWCYTATCIASAVACT